uniref:Uncharacterized protein n=1 Tax=Rhizophora mucronata TaxID=61149 RepID=A0A2P2J243_RHIMU
MVIDPICSRCGEAAETISHILLLGAWAVGILATKFPWLAYNGNGCD